MRIVAISDTHGYHGSMGDIPSGDILIHAGDMTNTGTVAEVVAFNRFLGSLPHRHKLVIAGNHDFCFESDRAECEAALSNATYLQDQEVIIEGVKFYGSPWQPWFFDWAFNLQRGPEIRAKWDLIPADTDVLITHGPPLDHGDRTFRGESVGCADLLAVVERIQPKFHIFGHIHEGAGHSTNGPTIFINASICGFNSPKLSRPIVFDYLHKRRGDPAPDEERISDPDTC